MEAGTQVRLVGDPGRMGTLTGRTRPRGPRTAYQVRFPAQTQYIPEDQLEAVDGLLDDPIDLLKSGRVGTAADLRRILTHVRLTGRLSDLIYSLETTKTDFYAYQYKPVLKMLEAPNQGLLIADEVGLGKTIEAGLIWTELRSRFDFRRLLVVCPAMLREKWRRELAYRFGVDADILNARQAHHRLQQAMRQGARGQFAIVASMQGLRPSNGSQASQDLFAFLDEHAFDEPLVDFLIVDEAHYMKNPESKTSRLGRRLRRIASHVALLSATPVHLGSEDLFQLLHLLDEDTFQYQSTFDQILEANDPLVRARDAVLREPVHGAELQEILEDASRRPLLRDNRQLAGLLEEIPAGEASLLTD